MPPSRRSGFFIILALLLGSALLGACGQKGDLYLPDKDTETDNPRG